ncbi:MAG: ABC transporter permease [Bacillota bacterium]
MQYLALYFDYVALGVKSQMQYHLSFAASTLLMFLNYAIEFTALMFAINKFNGITGWTADQVALLYGIATFCYGMARLLFRGYDRFSSLVRQGSLDVLLMRPVDERFQLMTYEFPIRRLGQVLLGLGVTFYALNRLDVTLTMWKLGFLILTLVSGTIIYGSLFIIGAAISFWTVESKELLGILTSGTLRMSSYPLSIYKPALRYLAIFVIPVAFVNFFPGLYLIGPMGPPSILYFLGPAVASILLLLSLKVWKYGLRAYQSTGS